MNIKLNLKDRFVIGELLPKQGNKLTMIIVKDILNKIDIDQNDIKEYEIIIKDDGFYWSPEKNKIEKNYDFTDAEFKIILDGIEESDKNNSIRIDMIDTIKKITTIHQITNLSPNEL